MRSPTRCTWLVPAIATAVVAALASGPSAQSAPEAAASLHRADVTQASPRGVRIIPLPPPSQFVRHITNPYLPLKPGSKWVYRGYAADRGEKVVVRVLKRTRMIAGIRATVVSDIATLDGKLIEKTRDWYAQDKLGRVWYLGEATTKYEDGTTSTAGSWETGVNGAKPGVAMFEKFPLNKRYFQEFLVGEAEDQGEILSRSGRVNGPAGSYRHVWITKDTTPLEPKILELKFYAPGVGMVLEIGTSPDRAGVELVRFKRG
ncbi:MAG: hypothetical protein ACRCYU_06305 [Nocardioides sp.]